MIILKATTETLQLVSSSAANLDYSISYADITATSFTPSSNEGKIASVTTTSILAAPAASTQRQVKLIVIANTSATTANSVSIQKLISGTAYMQTPVVTLLAGEAFQYMDGQGWVYYSSTGQLKGSQTAAGANAQVQLNSNGNLAGDIGLTFDVTNDILTLPNASSSIMLGTSAPTVSPAVPSTGKISVFGRTVANRGFVAAEDEFGLITSYQPLLARNKIGIWNAPGNSNTLPGVFGMLAPTAVGTATARTVATTNLANRMRRIGYPSGTAAASSGGMRLGAAMYSAGTGTAGDGSGFTFIQRWVESDPAVVAGRRAFYGMINSVAAFSNVEVNTLTNLIGITQLSTDATQWYWIGAGTTAQSAVAVGTAVGAPGGNSTTAWELAIYSPTTTANTFYLQLTNLTTGVVATKTFTGAAAAVPVSTVLLSWTGWVCNNATALAVGVDFSSLYFETDN